MLQRASNFLNDNYPFSSTTGGYGYLCSSESCSESYAVSQFNFDCSKLLNPDSCFFGKNKKKDTLLEAISKTVFKKLREKLFEYLKLSTAANPISFQKGFRRRTSSSEDIEPIETFDLNIPSFDGETSELDSTGLLLSRPAWKVMNF